VRSAPLTERISCRRKIAQHHLRSLISSLGAQFIIEANLPGLVFRTPPPPDTPPLPNGQPDRGQITLVIDPNENLSGAIFEGLDYEAIYILDAAIFGRGDLAD